jgi:hypothetical protein
MLGGQVVTQVLVSTVVVFLFVVSLLGLALGAGLLLRARAMLPFIQLMNQWVSTRRALKPLELPRQVAPAAGGTRWFGAVLIALGGFAAAILVGKFDATTLAGLFRVDARLSLAGVLLDAMRWFLAMGSLGAVFVGAMLLFFPGAWRRIEARANHWYSTRELEVAGDALHPTLDRIVEAFPRASGIAIVGLSVLAAVSSGALLFGRF